MRVVSREPEAHLIELLQLVEENPQGWQVIAFHYAKLQEIGNEHNTADRLDNGVDAGDGPRTIAALALGAQPRPYGKQINRLQIRVAMAAIGVPLERGFAARQAVHHRAGIITNRRAKHQHPDNTNDDEFMCGHEGEHASSSRKI
jgi:hypothetical protein